MVGKKKDAMRGLDVLKLALASASRTEEPLGAAQVVLKYREPNLALLEMTVLKHLAAVEDLLAHVRRMRIVNEPGYLDRPMTEDVKVLT